MANSGQSGQAAERNSMRPRIFPMLLTLAAAAAFGAPAVFASQPHPLPSASSAAHHATRHRAHAARKTTAKPATEAAAAKPKAAPAPVWPVNEKPNPAKVTWDAHGLEIVADNSSLDEILHEVGTDIGASVTGLSRDERVFGTYGPGPASAVLAKLLNGTGYNILMIGDRGNGAPRQIQLTTSSGGGSSPQQAGNAPGFFRSGSEDQGENGSEEPQEPSQPSPPMPLRNPFGNGGPPRSPQQIMQEMQQRQLQQIQQQNNQR